MIRWLNKKIKSEKGAISAFALMSMAFFLIFIVSIFIYFARRDSIQAETLRVLSDKYNDKTETDLVSTLVSNEADVIPIYSLDQLREIGSDKYITVPQEEGKIYQHIYKKDNYPDDDSEDRARYRLMQNWTLDELTAVLTEVANKYVGDPEKEDGFVGLESNQALGMYIVNFPNVTAGKLVVKKEIVASAPRAGQYDSKDSKFVYKITISNAGIVDVDNIQIKDVMQRRTTVEGNAESGDVELKVYKNRNDFVLSDEVVQTFTLESPIQEDGTESHTKGVTWDEWYVIYITDDDDVTNKNTLKNSVIVRGSSSGVTTTASAFSPDVIYGEKKGYSAEESLIVWYDALDNMAGSGATVGENDTHSSITTTWYDKDLQSEQTNAQIVIKDGGTNNLWINKKALWIRATTGNKGNQTRYLRGVKFQETNELKSIVGTIDGDYEYDFSIQLTFQLDIPENTGNQGNQGNQGTTKYTLYTFGKDDDSNHAFSINYNKNQERLEIDGGVNDISISIPIENGKPYILTFQGTYKYYDSVQGFFMFPSSHIYSLDWNATIKDVYGERADREGNVEKFENIEYYTGDDPDDVAMFGFDYNMLGKKWDNSNVCPMYIYSYRLYDRELTNEEITANIDAEMARYF